MRRVLLAAFVLGFPAAAAAQLSPSAAWAAHAANQYQVAANITYLTASNYEAKLDIYSRRGATTPQPTVIYFHGGFWAAGSKEGSLMSLLPWMEMGWNVVNVEYRLARIAPAPAAVEDCLCALRFIAAQARTYNIDLNRIVLTGESAGGHLTLTTGDDSRELRPGPPVRRHTRRFRAWPRWSTGSASRTSPTSSTVRIAANLAVTWLGSLPNKDEIAKRVSPLTWVRPGLPPDPDHPRRSGSARAVPTKRCACTRR